MIKYVQLILSGSRGTHIHTHTRKKEEEEEKEKEKRLLYTHTDLNFFRHNIYIYVH